MLDDDLSSSLFRALAGFGTAALAALALFTHLSYVAERRETFPARLQFLEKNSCHVVEVRHGAVHAYRCQINGVTAYLSSDQVRDAASPRAQP